MSRNIYNIYCDESCHLKAGNEKVMVWGAVWCAKERVKEFAVKIRKIKFKHKLRTNFEIKWTKVSKSKVEFYKDLIDFFFDESTLNFRGLYTLDKCKLDHSKYGNTHDEFYYIMYYYLLSWIIQSANSYNIYLDIKDTQGGEKVRTLKQFLAKKVLDYNFECIKNVQQIRSDESEILQIADLFIGALSYKARELTDNEGKSLLIKHIESKLSSSDLMQKSTYHSRKFNVFPWEAQ